MNSPTVMKQTNRNSTVFFIGFLAIGLLTMGLINNLHAKKENDSIQSLGQ